MADAFGVTRETGGATGQIVSCRDRSRADRRRVEENQIGVKTFTNLTAAGQTVELRRRVGDEPYRFLEFEEVAIAYVLAEQLDRVRERSQQIEMRTAIRTAEHHARV